MLESLEDLKSTLATSPLGKLKFVQIAIPDTGDSVFAAKLHRTDPYTIWAAARGLVERTGRWPLVVDLQFSGPFGSLEKRLHEVVLSRVPFEDETGIAFLPADIIEASAKIRVESYLERLARAADEYEDVDWVLEEIEAEFGRRPESGELDSSITYTAHRADRWAFERRLENGNVDGEPVARLTQLPPAKPVLILLPASSGADTLAWVGWYGAEGCHAETIAVLRQWDDKFGAELTANYGTMLEFCVANPPSDPIEAWQLAAQHDLLAPSNLAGPGISVRDYARELMRSDRWHLHERP